MKKFLISVFAILAVSVCAASDKDNHKVVNAFDFEGFTSLRLETAAEVTLIKSEDYSLTIAAPDDYFPYLNVEHNKKTGLLTIGYDKLPFKLKNSKHRVLEVTVSMPCLDALQLSGATTLKADSVFTTSTTMAKFVLDLSGSSKVEKLEVNASKAEIDLSGASKVKLDGEFGEVSVDISGASKLTLRGSTELLDAEVSGASKFNSENFDAAEVAVSASGASKANIYVGKRLEVSVSGASSCTYIAPDAIVIDVKGVSGASSLKHKEGKGKKGKGKDEDEDADDEEEEE